MQRKVVQRLGEAKVELGRRRFLNCVPKVSHRRTIATQRILVQVEVFVQETTIYVKTMDYIAAMLRRRIYSGRNELLRCGKHLLCFSRTLHAEKSGAKTA